MTNQSNWLYLVTDYVASLHEPWYVTDDSVFNMWPETMSHRILCIGHVASVHKPWCALQVSEAGVHRPHVAGIAGRENEGAYSIVLSGGYEDDTVSTVLAVGGTYHTGCWVLATVYYKSYDALVYTKLFNVICDRIFFNIS